jgi:hypothetical protein
MPPTNPTAAEIREKMKRVLQDEEREKTIKKVKFVLVVILVVLGLIALRELPSGNSGSSASCSSFMMTACERIRRGEPPRTVFGTNDINEMKQGLLACCDCLQVPCPSN